MPHHYDPQPDTSGIECKYVSATPLWSPYQMFGIECKYDSATSQLPPQPDVWNVIILFIYCIPGQKSGILRIQYGHAGGGGAEISFWTR